MFQPVMLVFGRGVFKNHVLSPSFDSEERKVRDPETTREKRKKKQLKKEPPQAPPGIYETLMKKLDSP